MLKIQLSPRKTILSCKSNFSGFSLIQPLLKKSIALHRRNCGFSWTRY